MSDGPRAGGVAAVVLAAGSSRRLGKPKQLIQLAGESLLRRSAHLAVEAGCSPVCVVLGFEAERMRGELESLGVEAVVNPLWEEGMGSSLRCGVEAVRGYAPEAVLVMVCDQPRLTAAHLRSLLAAHEEAVSGVRITASRYAGRAGVPAVFGAEVFVELATVRGDVGAREVLVREGNRLHTVEWPEGGFDVDEPEHVEGLVKE
jgi:molybdenum cofactor cytidylyltransferase